jgi:hypothetical protein
MRSTLAPFLAPALLAGCINVSPPGTSFASDPPGARVHIDGRDSGWVTPCLVALDEGEPHVVTLALDGYAPREVVLRPLTRNGVVAWYQAVNGVKSTIRFPLLHPTEDLLLPFRASHALSPGHVFVRLRPTEAP